MKKIAVQENLANEAVAPFARDAPAGFAGLRIGVGPLWDVSRPRYRSSGMWGGGAWTCSDRRDRVFLVVSLLFPCMCRVTLFEIRLDPAPVLAQMAISVRPNAGSQHPSPR